MRRFSVGVDVGWGTDGFNPISEARPRRSCSPTPSGRNGPAPVRAHRLWEPGVGSSVDDFCILADSAVFVQHNVVGCLERGQYVSTADMDEEQRVKWVDWFSDGRTRTRQVMPRRKTAPLSQLAKEGDLSHARPTPDQTTSISQRHRPRNVVWGSSEVLQTITRTRLTTAGVRRRNEAK